MTLEMVGPFEESYHYAVLEGYRVPNITLRPVNPQQTEWTIRLTGNSSGLVMDVPAELLYPVVGFIAEAMAVGAGWSSYAQACDHANERHNPFGKRLIALDEMPAESESHL